MARVNSPVKSKIAVIEANLALELETANTLSAPLDGMRTISGNSYSSTVSASFKIPDDLYSMELFVFLGFQRQAANLLFRRWYNGNDREGHVAEPMPYIKGYLREFSEITERDGTEVWSIALQQIGIQMSLISAILNPHFENLRNTKTAREWLLDTFETRYEFLQGLNNTLTARKNTHSAHRQAQESVEAVVGVSEEQLRGLSGHTMLYKSGPWEYFKPAFLAEGRYDFNGFLSTPPTNFHPVARLLYLYEQREVAEQYAHYASERSPNHEIAIMAFAIPNHFLSGAYQLWNHEDSIWRELVHTSCGRRNPRPRLPDHLLWTEEKPLKVGNICGQSSGALKAIAAQDIIPLRLQGGSVSQYCFSDSLFSRLGAELKDKVAVQIIRAERPESAIS